MTATLNPKPDPNPSPSPSPNRSTIVLPKEVTLNPKPDPNLTLALTLNLTAFHCATHEGDAKP